MDVQKMLEILKRDYGIESKEERMLRRTGIRGLWSHVPEHSP